VYDESSGNSDKLRTYLYDFPDPISKVGIQTEKSTNDTHLSARLWVRMSKLSRRDANAKLTSQNTRIEPRKSMI